MKKLVKVVFTYEDGTSDKIDDAKAALLFQSRINGAGIISGMEALITSNDQPKDDEVPK